MRGESGVGAPKPKPIKPGHRAKQSGQTKHKHSTKEQG